MKPRSYWEKRAEQIASRQFRSGEVYILELAREYNRAKRTIRQDTDSFYQRYADDNGIVTMDEARKQLDAGEMADFKMTLEEFIAKAKDNADGRWTKELNNAYYRQRISRYQALELQINHQSEMLAASRQAGAEKLLGDVYKDSYYRTMHMTQTGAGIGKPFAKIDEKGLDRALKADLSGDNWSSRIWQDRDKLRREVHTNLSQAFIRGDSIDRTTKVLAERMDVSYSNAARLVRTESAFFVEQGTMASYKESGIVLQYRILATLDSRTSDICQNMEGKVFPLSEKDVGVNCPPFHVNCRSTTVAYFDDEDDEDPGERIARGADGKTYMVPSDMTYKQWYDKYVA